MRVTIGDRVVAINDIGVFRPRVPKGTFGTVAGLTEVGEAEVQFDNGRVELVRPERLSKAA
jgi:hypothetical protein